MSESSYRIEITPNNRAGCQDALCKFTKEKLRKGELRLGVWVEIPSNQFPASWKWRHWGCVSGQTIAHIREAIKEGESYDWDKLDGYDELEDEDVKEKVRRCIEQGHIATEDFKGDPEFNKLGAKGIRSHKHLDRLKHPEKYIDEDGNEIEDKKPTPRKPTPKKVAAAKKGKKTAADDNETEGEQGPASANKAKAKAPPKSKAGSKRSKIADEEQTDEEPEAHSEPLKKKARTGRGAAPVKKEESDAEEAIPSPKARGRKAAVVKKGAREEQDSDEEASNKPIAKPRGRKVAVVKKEESTEEEDVKPAPKARGRAAAKASVVKKEEPASDSDEADKKPIAKPGGRKATIVKKEEPDSEEEKKPIAKPRGRKAAVIKKEESDAAEERKPIANPRDRKAAVVKREESTEEEDVKPAPKARGRAAAKASVVKKEPASDSDEPGNKPITKPRGRKAPVKKENSDSDVVVNGPRSKEEGDAGASEVATGIRPSNRDRKLQLMVEVDEEPKEPAAPVARRRSTRARSGRQSLVEAKSDDEFEQEDGEE